MALDEKGFTNYSDTGEAPTITYLFPIEIQKLKENCQSGQPVTYRESRVFRFENCNLH